MTPGQNFGQSAAERERMPYPGESAEEFSARLRELDAAQTDELADEPEQPEDAEQPESTRVQDQWHTYKRRDGGSTYLVYAGPAGSMPDGARTEPEPDSDRVDVLP